MKKRKFWIAAICAAVVGVGVFGAACDGSEEDPYEALNEKLHANYSQITVTVTDAFSEDSSLVSEYVVKKSDGGVTVSYSVERFAQLSLESPVGGAKTTLVGESKIQGGAVTHVSGAEIELPSDIVNFGLNFKKEYFANADLTGIYLKADVTDASGFMGSELTCSDMKVSATFLEIFYDIKITYKTQGGNSVVYNYVFAL